MTNAIWNSRTYQKMFGGSTSEINQKEERKIFKNMELNLKEMEKVSGGSKAYELAMEFRRYVDSLEAKYQCVDGGLDYLKTVCTPEERNKIHELSEAWYASLFQ